MKKTVFLKSVILILTGSITLLWSSCGEKDRKFFVKKYEIQINFPNDWIVVKNFNATLVYGVYNEAGGLKEFIEEESDNYQPNISVSKQLVRKDYPGVKEYTIDRNLKLIDNLDISPAFSTEIVSSEEVKINGLSSFKTISLIKRDLDTIYKFMSFTLLYGSYEYAIDCKATVNQFDGGTKAVFEEVANTFKIIEKEEEILLEETY